MAKKKGTGVSPLTNRIYYGTQDTEKHMWLGQKTDITDSAIASVFEWFMANIRQIKQRCGEVRHDRLFIEP